MSEVLDTEVFGDPRACSTAAGRAAGVRQAVTTARGRAEQARATAGGWHGRAGAAFEARVERAVADAASLGERIEAMERALTDFAGELTAVEEKMARARQVAAAGGLAVSGTQVVRPVAPGGALTPAEADAFDRVVQAWNEAVAIADDARAKEQEAHARLGDGIARSTGDGFLTNLMQRLGLLPPDFADHDDGAGWLFGLGGLAFGATVGWKVHGRYGVFQPRVNGRFGTTSGLGFWERARLAPDPDNWHARPYQAATRNRWATAGTWASRAGTAVTAVTAGWNQWQADADDPSMGDTERGARAATMGASTAAGAWAGAQGGAWAGGAIGTAICPGIGTAVGGVVGGVVGGAIGGFAGSELGSAVVDEVGDAADAAADWMGDTVDSAGETLSDVGDAVTFWD